MESNPMSGGIYSNLQPSMLGLEMSLHHNLPSQNPQNPHHIPPHPHPHHPIFATNDHLQQQHQPKQAYPKSKNQSLTLSDDDEPGFTAENSNGDDGKRKMSPWQRMKWTDDMVRLLIMVVFYIGDEVGTEGNDPASKKKGSGVLQKKGKWKSVSRAMMERGFYVSPQQCEDKFNDLNKRYKRVNDILGKGTSCRVVENQALLDAMELSPKVKDEVKKLLNSKHLFFREMCAYHNSCGHNSAAGGMQHSPPEAAAAEQPPQVQQQRCLHSTEKAPVMPNLNRGEHEGSRLAKGVSVDDDEDDEDEEEDEDGDEEEDDDDEVMMMGGSGLRFHDRGHGDDNDMDERLSRKRARKGMTNSALIQQLDGEIMNMLRDGGKTPSEKRQWLKTKQMMLEEQRVGIQSQSFELEKQRLKWLKFSTKKEREMEREKLINERTKLENERMVLLIKQKELDLIEHHHHHQQQQHSSNKKSDPSSITG